MEPYVVAIVMILFVLACGIIIVYNVYKHRTREPDINAIKDKILNDMGLPDNVDNNKVFGMVKK